ncbi:hypothetical protein IWQ60_011210 [Tieghemiomyces parasiticus]|uniref:Myb-like domain-containing protein n=1 Tax=Tieghemiomyces parasiticus TaxID=78921 RepID=A0A9W8DHI4_9FUNG|nr:hypothetical protein IWQ60_011210 [Tieghemiomyces parasiticus]
MNTRGKRGRPAKAKTDTPPPTFYAKRTGRKASEGRAGQSLTHGTPDVLQRFRAVRRPSPGRLSFNPFVDTPERSTNGHSDPTVAVSSSPLSSWTTTRREDLTTALPSSLAPAASPEQAKPSRPRGRPRKDTKGAPPRANRPSARHSLPAAPASHPEPAPLILQTTLTNYDFTTLKSMALNVLHSMYTLLAGVFLPPEGAGGDAVQNRLEALTDHPLWGSMTENYLMLSMFANTKFPEATGFFIDLAIAVPVPARTRFHVARATEAVHAANLAIFMHSTLFSFFETVPDQDAPPGTPTLRVTRTTLNSFAALCRQCLETQQFTAAGSRVVQAALARFGQGAEGFLQYVASPNALPIDQRTAETLLMTNVWMSFWRMCHLPRRQLGLAVMENTQTLNRKLLEVADSLREEESLWQYTTTDLLRASFEDLTSQLTLRLESSSSVAVLQMVSWAPLAKDFFAILQSTVEAALGDLLETDDEAPAPTNPTAATLPVTENETVPPAIGASDSDLDPAAAQVATAPTADRQSTIEIPSRNGLASEAVTSTDRSAVAPPTTVNSSLSKATPDLLPPTTCPSARATEAASLHLVTARRTTSASLERASPTSTPTRTRSSSVVEERPASPTIGSTTAVAQKNPRAPIPYSTRRQTSLIPSAPAFNTRAQHRHSMPEIQSLLAKSPAAAKVLSPRQPRRKSTTQPSAVEVPTTKQPVVYLAVPDLTRTMATSSENTTPVKATASTAPISTQSTPEPSVEACLAEVTRQATEVHLKPSPVEGEKPLLHAPPPTFANAHVDEPTVSTEHGESASQLQPPSETDIMAADPLETPSSVLVNDAPAIEAPVKQPVPLAHPEPNDAGCSPVPPEGATVELMNGSPAPRPIDAITAGGTPSVTASPSAADPAHAVLTPTPDMTADAKLTQFIQRFSVSVRRQPAETRPLDAFFKPITTRPTVSPRAPAKVASAATASPASVLSETIVISSDDEAEDAPNTTEVTSSSPTPLTPTPTGRLMTLQSPGKAATPKSGPAEVPNTAEREATQSPDPHVPTPCAAQRPVVPEPGSPKAVPSIVPKWPIVRPTPIIDENSPHSPIAADLPITSSAAGAESSTLGTDASPAEEPAVDSRPVPPHSPTRSASVGTMEPTDPEVIAQAPLLATDFTGALPATVEEAVPCIPAAIPLPSTLAPSRPFETAREDGPPLDETQATTPIAQLAVDPESTASNAEGNPPADSGTGAPGTPVPVPADIVDAPSDPVSVPPRVAAPNQVSGQAVVSIQIVTEVPADPSQACAVVSAEVNCSPAAEVPTESVTIGPSESTVERQPEAPSSLCNDTHLNPGPGAMEAGIITQPAESPVTEKASSLTGDGVPPDAPRTSATPSDPPAVSHRTAPSSPVVIEHTQDGALLPDTATRESTEPLAFGTTETTGGSPPPSVAVKAVIVAQVQRIEPPATALLEESSRPDAIDETASSKVPPASPPLPGAMATSANVTQSHSPYAIDTAIVTTSIPKPATRRPSRRNIVFTNAVTGSSSDESSSGEEDGPQASDPARSVTVIPINVPLPARRSSAPFQTIRSSSSPSSDSSDSEIEPLLTRAVVKSTADTSDDEIASDDAASIDEAMGTNGSKAGTADPVPVGTAVVKPTHALATSPPRPTAKRSRSADATLFDLAPPAKRASISPTETAETIGHPLAGLVSMAPAAALPFTPANLEGRPTPFNSAMAALDVALLREALEEWNWDALILEVREAKPLVPMTKYTATLRKYVTRRHTPGEERPAPLDPAVSTNEGTYARLNGRDLPGTSLAPPEPSANPGAQATSSNAPKSVPVAPPMRTHRKLPARLTSPPPPAVAPPMSDDSGASGSATPAEPVSACSTRSGQLEPDAQVPAVQLARTKLPPNPTSSGSDSNGADRAASPTTMGGDAYGHNSAKEGPGAAAESLSPKRKSPDLQDKSDSSLVIVPDRGACKRAKLTSTLVENHRHHEVQRTEPILNRAGSPLPLVNAESNIEIVIDHKTFEQVKEEAAKRVTAGAQPKLDKAGVMVVLDAQSSAEPPENCVHVDTTEAAAPDSIHNVEPEPVTTAPEPISELNTMVTTAVTAAIEILVTPPAVSQKPVAAPSETTSKLSTVAITTATADIEARTTPPTTGLMPAAAAAVLETTNNLDTMVVLTAATAAAQTPMPPPAVSPEPGTAALETTSNLNAVATTMTTADTKAPTAPLTSSLKPTVTMTSASTQTENDMRALHRRLAGISASSYASMRAQAGLAAALSRTPPVVMSPKAPSLAKRLKSKTPTTSSASDTSHPPTVSATTLNPSSASSRGCVAKVVDSSSSPIRVPSSVPPTISAYFRPVGASNTSGTSAHYPPVSLAARYNGTPIYPPHRHRDNNHLWTDDEQSALDAGVRVYGRKWQFIFRDYGPQGVVNTALKNRTVDQLRTRALKIHRYRQGHGLPLGIYQNTAREPREK